MKSSKPVVYLLPFVGIFLMAFYGSQIRWSLTGTHSGPGCFVLPGYSIGLLMICGSMVAGLAYQVREMKARIEKLENEDASRH